MKVLANPVANFVHDTIKQIFFHSFRFFLFLFMISLGGKHLMTIELINVRKMKQVIKVF